MKFLLPEVLVWVVLTPSLVTYGVSGECLHQGRQYSNNSVWQPELCQVCHCSDPVSVCETIACQDPQCQQGQGLELLPDTCCPVCSFPGASCDVSGTPVPHDTVWSTTPCSSCHCYDGDVTCDDVTCPLISCRPREVKQEVEGECCPQCVPTGRPCEDESGVRMPDGSEWSPLACVQCFCRDGQTRCLPLQCPPLQCAQSELVTLTPGQCCPTCREQTCDHKGHTYQDEENWSPDPCTFCTCRSGRVSCHTLSCDLSLDCPPEQQVVRKHGECCPQCVRTHGLCDKDGIRRYHGDQWQEKACEFCACQQGAVLCNVATCSDVVCKENELLLPADDAGSCCPRCVKAMPCQVKGQTFQDGETWDLDPCAVCQCHRGEVTCYRQRCPACPENTVRDTRQADGLCCGTCLPVTCGTECSSCLPSQPEQCTGCKDQGRLLQDGRCVAQCADGRVPGMDNTCRDCHPECRTCFDQSRTSCLTCRPPLLLQSGQCVRQCGDGFFERDDFCLACHVTCGECSGPRRDQCLTCRNQGQVTTRGRCVDGCGQNFYRQGRTCIECPAICARCRPDSDQCAACRSDRVLHDGQCVQSCPTGWFSVGRSGFCQACHPSCVECNGLRAENCTVCFNGVPTSEGSCVPDTRCEAGRYLSSDGICADCAPSCARCQSNPSDPTTTLCYQCLEPDHVPAGDVCSREGCPPGTYRRGDACHDCEERCARCVRPTGCLQCFPPFLLSDRNCVTDCGPGTFAAGQQCEMCPRHCLECSSNVTCVACDRSSLLQGQVCVTACSAGYVARLEQRTCQPNRHPPELTISGPVTVPEGGVVGITDRIISLTDMDTPFKYLMVVVEAMKLSGQLIRVDSMGSMMIATGDSVSALDLREGRVRILHRPMADTKDSYLSLRASDGQFSSAVRKLTVHVEPSINLDVAVNKPLQARSGQDVQLTSSVLDIAFVSRADTVVITAANGPSFGHFHIAGRQDRANSFTLAQLKDGAVFYRHLGNDAITDLARLLVADEREQIALLFRINIRTLASELPLMVTNAGGHMMAGEMLKITTELLEARVSSENDARDQGIIYTLVPRHGNPEHGELIMLVPIPAEGPGPGWQAEADDMMSARLYRFMQRDIDHGRIYYRSLANTHARSATGSFTDVLKFEVSDTSVPAHRLQEQTFSITVAQHTVQPQSVPTLAPGVRLGMTVFENQIVPIGSTHLAFADQDTDPSSIQYRITSLLSKQEGSVEHRDFPFRQVLQFTQADVDEGKILYRPPMGDIGMEEKMVSFAFVVSDGGRERELSEHKFTIRVVPVNNNPPVFLKPDPKVNLAEGGVFPLTPSLLEVSDPDTDLSDLQVAVTVAPRRGVVQKVEEGMAVQVREGDTFSYEDMVSSNLQYTHTGSVQPPTDKLSVTVSDGPHQAKTTITFHILKVDRSAPSTVGSASCSINITEGESLTLGRDVMAYADDEDGDSKILITLMDTITHGSLEMTTGEGRSRKTERVKVGGSFTQQDINDGKLSFVADREIGARAVTELVYVNVSDASRNVLPSQILAVLISPEDNQPPSVVPGSALQVEEGGEAELTSDLLSVMDVDTPLEHLMFTIDTQPVFGHLEIRTPGAETDVLEPAGRSIPLTDLLSGHVHYIQSDHEEKEPARDAFLFSVSDGINTSPMHRLNISIDLVNDESPHIVSEQIYAKEGGVVTLTNASLYVTDLDTPPEDLIFTLIQTPSNGQLIKKEFFLDATDQGIFLGEKGTFTYEDILNELILYAHDDGETTQDSLTLDLTDGDFGETKVVYVVVGLVGDETPRVTINRGLRLKKGSSTVISSQDLKATDLDSDDPDITYTVMMDPSSGQLQFDDGKVKYALTTSGAHRRFKQRDIDAGHISYTHSQHELAGMMLFKFKLTDPESNDLIDQDFFITVVDDRLPPTLVHKEKLLVKEGGSSLLTTGQLAFTDADSEPGALTYTLLDGPDLGHLELIGQSGVPIVTFTQTDLAASIVQYIHTSEAESYADQLTFMVSDGSNEIVQSFHISILPVDDVIPMVSNHGLRVQEGVRKIVSEFDLKAVDKDTKENQIIFTVVEPPSHGSLDLLNPEEDEHAPAFTFTMEDIYENRLSYQHDGSETTEDYFLFLVSDGTNKKFALQKDQPIVGAVDSPQDFPITILPMDDGTPVLSTNLGLQYLTRDVRTGEVSKLITPRELSATDEDTPSTHVLYRIVQPPQNGQLEHTQYPGLQVDSFSQDDIDKARIRYKLTNRSPRLEDSFRFDLLDTKPNILPDNAFHVTWSEVSLGRAVFNTTEDQGVLRVPVIRTGNLKQYALVTCTLTPGSAMSRTDMTSPGQQDYVGGSTQIQFEEWQESQSCPVIINDDSVFEGPETFYVELTSPTFALLGQVTKAAVTIVDTEDEPVLQFASDVIHVNETNTYVMAIVERSGDVSQAVSAVCSSKSLSATGSSLNSLESGSDYISRGRTNAYRVVFPPGLAQVACDVKIIDDSLYENAEQFELELSAPSHPATLGPMKTALVVIEGPNDESIVYMGSESLAFPEDSGEMSVPVTRQGSDLSQSSSVWCHTRLSTPLSAEPGQDYTPTSVKVTFGPGQTSQMCHIELLDDEFSPRLEGNETLEVFLSAVTGSLLEQPTSASIIIYDQHLDLPKFSFSKEAYTVEEANGTLTATIVRQGDITLEASVICYTRQGTAHVMMDFAERFLSNASRVVFAPGEQSKPCVVNIVDDKEFEPEEEFRIKLISPLGPEGVGARLEQPDTATITVTNDEDVPRVQLERSAYSVHEPAARHQVAVVKVKVVRTGALDQTVSVRCSTRDGSAQSGSDYNPKSEVLTFQPDEWQQEFSVDILYTSAVEWHEDFRVQLGPDEPTNAKFGNVTMATITILDTEVSGSIILPAAPLVVSLLHYDDAEQGMKVDPSPGYPLVCLTPCDMQYPESPTTYALCEESGVNRSTILYQWEVAMPASEDGVASGFVKVTDKTLFTPVDQKVLDSIYFRPFFKIRCVAQPFHENGNAGVPLRSLPVTIGHNNAICKTTSPSGASTARLSGSYQAQSFLASLEYVRPEQGDTEHANMVHISVQIPHQDGMLPLVSTMPLHNLRLLLAEHIYRQQHVCSNIITARERVPLLLQHGFLGDSMSASNVSGGSAKHSGVSHNKGSKLPFGPGFDFPHQFDAKLRGESALLLYKHLNLKTCSWTFDAWYHMTELLDLCGGQVVSDFQVRQNAKTYLTIKVPLHVSYVFATAPVGWGSLEHRTEMEVSFYYNSVLWQSGLETEGGQGGRLQVVRILIADSGKLLIEFRTHTKFKGQFLMQHHTLPGVTSRVVSTLTSAVTFDLELVWSQATFDGPLQVWRATSNYNVKDYTGDYTVELIPCLVPPTLAFDPTADPLPCTAREPERFEVRISFQQSNRPVPLSYSLNTEFQLSNNARMFLMDPATPDPTAHDWDFPGTFSRGEKLYGRVLWNPDQDLSSAYRLLLEKVYLCTGRDGYVPAYDPSGETYKEGTQFGCIQPSQKLLHRFLILDRENPDSAVTDFHQVPFNARLASQVTALSGMDKLPGVDGFVMDIDPLYKVDSGHQWHLQVVYTISPADAPNSRTSRSTLVLPILSQVRDHSSSRRRRSISNLPGNLSTRKRRRDTAPSSNKSKTLLIEKGSSKQTVGLFSSEAKVSSKEIRNGTNMMSLRLAMDDSPQQPGDSSTVNSIVIVIVSICVVILLLSVCCVIAVCFRKRRRKRKKEEEILQSGHLSTRNNLRNDAAAEVMFASAKCKDKGRQGSGVSKCNIIKAKETNLLSKLGKKVEIGTEV